jgi:uncharacterized Zn finger protein (UPF0148 family)
VSLSIHCPSCGEPVEIEDRYAGWTVRCPICRHEFVAPTAPAVPVEAETEPSRGRRSTAARARRAAEAVADPAVWLRVLGIMEIIVGLLITLLFTTIGIQAANNPAQAVKDMNVQNEEELWTGIIVWVVGGVCVAVSGVFVLIGASKMARLESHGWGVAAGVLACIPFLNCCCVGLPIGVWALTVLGRPDVQDAFAATRRRREEPDAFAD